MKGPYDQSWKNIYICKTCGQGVINGLHNVGPWLHLNGSDDHLIVPIDRPKEP